MTPLLHEIMNELSQPIRKRKLEFHEFETRAFAKLLEGTQSFECTGVLPLAQSLAVKVIDGMIARDSAGADVVEGVTSKTTSFLPAKRTWIEFDSNKLPGGGDREAMLLINDDRSNADARCIWLHRCEDDPHAFDVIEDSSLALSGSRRAAVPIFGTRKNTETGESLLRQIKAEFPDNRGPNFVIDHHSVEMTPEAVGRERKQFVTARTYGLLGMINTPHIFQRIVHQPHAGLQRKMVGAKSLIGQFPLGAWTEILLKVPMPEGGPKSESGTDGYLSGERALHWCRAHLRYRLGQWEVVSDHWRGNPAIGIKQSRYRLEPNREH